MSGKLRPYMGYERTGGPEEGAILIFAHNAREARHIGWATPTFLRDACDGEYFSMAVRLIKDASHLYGEADKTKLADDSPHVIECPTSCNGCDRWGYELDVAGYCESCAEDKPTQGHGLSKQG